VSADFCENCGSKASFAPLFAASHATRRCQRCDGWHHFAPLPAAAAELYDRDYFFGAEYRDYDLSRAAQRINFQRKLRLLTQAGCTIGASSRVLELGCATGDFLALVRQQSGASTLGIEVSAFARGRALEQGLSVLSPDDPELTRRVADFAPDFIVAWDVWEHLSHPATVFDAHIAAARRGVVVALTTVDASSAVARLRGHRWRQFHPPTHLNYPTRRSLRSFLQDRAFQVRSQQSFGYHRPLLEYVGALGLQPHSSDLQAQGTSAQSTAGQATGTHYTAPQQTLTQRWLVHPVYLNLYDTQLVIAQRRGS
jgi:cyclopropane fatty-acyl-phospholipid synthase-like methyltransferase